MAELQYNSKLKSFQTDGGTEFKPLTNFLASQGVVHRLTCPYTHHQNGSVERKHRHVVETGLTLLAHSHLPMQYWDYAFCTAVYLINRMPTSVLHAKSPFTTLYKTSPDYKLMKVFGCACFPLLRPYNQAKMSFHSKECVFLGYCPQHKGYKCLDVTGKIYLSKDVLFNEYRFPYPELFPEEPSVCTSLPKQPTSIPFPIGSYPLVSNPLVSNPSLIASSPSSSTSPFVSSCSVPEHREGK